MHFVSHRTLLSFDAYLDHLISPRTRVGALHVHSLALHQSRRPSTAPDAFLPQTSHQRPDPPFDTQVPLVRRAQRRT